jgi:hypothetical protein
VASTREALKNLLSELPGDTADSGDLDYFLAMSHAFSYQPVVVPVMRGKSPAGVLLAARRLILGQAIGIVEVGRFCEGQPVIASESEKRFTLQQALRELCSWEDVHTVRLRTTPDRSLIETLSKIPDTTFDSEIVEIRDTLSLGSSLEEFLQTLGRRTRRNFRYYRRKALMSGCTCVEIAEPGLGRVAAKLVAHQRTSSYTGYRIQRFVAGLRRMPHPIFLGLQSPDGVWLSMIGGWHADQRGYLLFQLNHNDQAYDRVSLSVALRSHFFERLIERGVREVRFLGGLQGNLQMYCGPTENQVITLRKVGWRSRLFLKEESLRMAGSRRFGRVLSAHGI